MGHMNDLDERESSGHSRANLEARAHAQYAVSRILAESHTTLAALPRVLEVLCQHLGWDLGNVWWVDAEAKILRFKETWHREGLSFQAFDQATATRGFALGLGLPGRVWATGKPCWLDNVADEENFPRSSAAARDGLHSASAYPIVFNQDVIGILEFFSREVREVDEDFVETMAAIGRQVGQFIERSLAEQRLRESEARNAAILATALDCIVTIDHEDRIVEFNPAAEKTFGYSHAEAMGKHMAELLVPPKYREAHYRGMRHYLETGEGPVLGKRIEVEAMRADGSFFPVELAITPIRVGAKPVFTAYLRDITARKWSEVRQQFLADLAAATQPLVSSGEVTAMAARMLREHLDCDRCAYAEVEDEAIFVITGDDTRSVPSIAGRWPVAAFGAECERMMLANESYIVTDTDTDPRLNPRDLEAYRATTIRAVICVPLHKDGRFTAAMAVHQKTPRTWTSEEVELVEVVVNRCWESLERARVTRDLQASEAKFRQLANTIPQLAWMARADGSIFWYNDRWYAYTGTVPEDMEGWGWQRVHDPSVLPSVLESWNHSIETGEPFDMTFPLKGADGLFRPFLTGVNPLRNEAGEVVLWFGTNTDVSEQVKLEEDRKQVLDAERAARSDAERVSRMKDEFLATLSHELRTPLNAILGYATLLQNMRMSEAEMKDAASVIQRNAKAQAQIIEDLLDMNRIIAGKIRLDVQQVALPDVIEAAIETVKPSAEAKDIRIQAFLDPVAGPVRGDPARIQQVIWNLLSNALKFTDKGGRIQISLERVNSHVEISIVDTGQGIAPDFLPYVFDRFRQADSSTTRHHGGLGLGLAIVKQLVESHGGSVRAKSPGPGLGATFIVSFPVAVMHEEAERERRIHPKSPASTQSFDCQPDLLGVSVLIVDDDQDSCGLVKRVLEECHAEVDMAFSAAEAHAKLMRRKYDVLVSDIGMPGEDGYQFIRRVRSLSADMNGQIPAVALTAFARSEDRRRAALAGFQTHISKPVEPAELSAIIAGLAGRV